VDVVWVSRALPGVLVEKSLFQKQESIGYLDLGLAVGQSRFLVEDRFAMTFPCGWSFHVPKPSGNNCPFPVGEEPVSPCFQSVKIACVAIGNPLRFIRFSVGLRFLGDSSTGTAGLSHSVEPPRIPTKTLSFSTRSGRVSLRHWSIRSASCLSAVPIRLDSFRATGITAYLENGGTIENVQHSQNIPRKRGLGGFFQKNRPRLVTKRHWMSLY